MAPPNQPWTAMAAVMMASAAIMVRPLLAAGFLHDHQAIAKPPMPIPVPSQR